MCQGGRCVRTVLLCFWCLRGTMMDMERIESPLLSTGDVASVLGVSRQHVVDLCDRGDLIFVRVGSHRRVPRFELDRLLGAVHEGN